MIATVVDTKALLETVVYSVAAGLGVCVTVSMAILGVTASFEANRERKPVVAGAWALLAVAGVLATAGAIVMGIIVMSSK